MPFDLRVMLDVFLSMMFAEVIAKPVAIRTGRWILRRTDYHLPWIPDWLYKDERVKAVEPGTKAGTQDPEYPGAS
jgi:hypothetical protein